MTAPAPAPVRVAGPATGALLTAGLAAILCAVGFGADSGLQLGRTTPVEMGLILGGGLAVAGAVLLVPRPARIWGAGPLIAMLALAVLTAVSITWAAQPSDAWIEANRTLAYAAVFAGAVALAHGVPGRWSSVLGAITLAVVVMSAYALVTKIAPGDLNPDEIYARLREPFGYWNSVGLMAALGVPGCLWLGARRTGHQGLNALAYPAMGLLVLTMLMAYSRGALLAAGLGAAFWFCTVPLRLRGAAVVLIGGGGGAIVAAWAFSQNALTDDRVPVDLRNQAGLQLGLALVVVLVVLTLAGLALNFATAQIPRSTLMRDRLGIALLVAVALVPVGVVAKLALADGGLGSSVSRNWKSLTDPNAAIPINDPSRLTAAGSVRARYWDEALRIFQDNVAGGVGAGGYATVRKRYRTADPAVRHAHGYVVQTARRPRAGGARREPCAARRVARRRRAGDRPAPPRPRARVHGRANRAADARRHRRRLRRALVHRLDVVRARERRRRAARGRLGGRARPAAVAPAARATTFAARCASACAPGSPSPPARAPRPPWSCSRSPAPGPSGSRSARRRSATTRRDARHRQRRRRARAGAAGARPQPAVRRPALRAVDDRDGGGAQVRGPQRVGAGSAPAARQPRGLAATGGVRARHPRPASRSR